MDWGNIIMGTLFGFGTAGMLSGIWNFVERPIFIVIFCAAWIALFEKII